MRAALETLGASVHLGKIRQDVIAQLGNELACAAQRVAGDAVSAVDPQHRLACGVEEASVA
jgi:hypothetical protein